MNILFFTPHISLWAHTVPESYLAKALRSTGHSIQHLTCGAVQTYCAVMTSFGLEPGSTSKKAAYICSLCKMGSQNLTSSYGFNIDKLSNYLSTLDIDNCKRIAKKVIDNRSMELSFLGVNVGKLSLYEFTLFHKKMSTNFTDAQWDDYGVFLTNSIITLLGFSYFLEKNQIHTIVTYSPQYSNINSCMQYAMQKGIRVLFMEAGNNLNHRLGTMRVWDWGVHRLVNPALKYWVDSKKNPVSLKAAKEVSAHFAQLLKGEHFVVFSAAYSGHKTIREKWSIRADQKILLMTLSSYDEAYAAFLIDAFPEKKVFSKVFRTQVEWIESTIKWISKRLDLFLVIRVHPRDFPNKREQTRSEQSVILEKILKNLPPNVYVNWPSEGVALYEIFEDTDTILTGWSVTGVEGLALGIPVVTYDQTLPSYPSDIMLTGASELEYFANIDRALDQGWDFKNVINGFRWLAYNFVDSTVVVSEYFGRYELGGQNMIQKIWRKIKNRFPSFGQRFDLLFWHKALDDVQVVSKILTQDFDSISSIRSANRSYWDDKDIVEKELEFIYKLLNTKSKLPVQKPGLLKNIRNYLENKKIL